MDIFNPLLPYFSPGGARVKLSATGAIFDYPAAELEGFARPLWGLTPLAAGGADFAHWELFRQGLANGTDPEHPEYWGQVNSTDQRMVELAAVGASFVAVRRTGDVAKGLLAGFVVLWALAAVAP